jgi:ABC-2 type transport system permease protein
MSYKALFGWIKPEVYITTKVASPIFQIIFFAIMASYGYRTNNITPYVVGNAIVLCTLNAIFGVGGIMAQEREFGTLKIVLATPVNKFVVFVGRSFFHILDGLSTVFIGFMAGILFFGMDLSGTNIPLLLLTLVISVFAASGLGLLIGSLGLVITDMNLIMNLASMGLLALSGANFPIEKLPVFMQKLCYVLPLTRGIKASRLLVTGSGFSSVQSLIAGEFIIGVAYTLTGYLLLRYMERRSRHTGNFDLY